LSWSPHNDPVVLNMTLSADIALVSLVAKCLVVLGLMICGIHLLRQAKRARRPATVVNGRVVAKGLQRIAPIVVVPSPPRLKPGAELGRLADVIQGAHTRLETITSCQRAASRHLDSAEVALNSLLAEIVIVMPPTIMPSVLPRRTMAMAA
jgi:hypothetical protein